KDRRFLDLYWKLVRAGSVEAETSIPSRIGVPHGGLLSPLLSNIYLHEFDEYMDQKITELSSKEKLISKDNPRITNYTKKLNKLSAKYSETRDPSILQEFRSVRMERNQVPSRIRTGVRIRYLRYADD